MQCLTPNQCSAWLSEHRIIESPYSRDDANEAFCLQFEPPEKASRLTAFTRALFDECGNFPGALIVFTDWSAYSPDEMAMINKLRGGHGEKRWLIATPGHLFEPTEKDDAIGFCYLAVTFGWTAYLYLASGAVTVLFWEGDLIDVWSFDGLLPYMIRGLVEKYELRITSDTDA